MAYNGVKIMKKIILSTLAVVLSLSVMAQAQSLKDKNATRAARADAFVSATTADCHTAKDATPTWKHIHTPFTTTDINGNTIDVAAILASGKAIVIDYSATWCSPCYRLHQSKNLEAIHNQLGSQVCVLWVETDNSTTLADIEGTGSSTQGDWTHYSDGSAVSYPIIDCPSCHSMIDPTGYVPEVAFIAPNGYYTQIYGESWGVSIDMSNADAVANIQALIASAPAAGQAPTFVTVDGPDVVFAGSNATFNTTYVSVDNVTGINWTFAGADVTTGTGASATTTYTTPGNYTVTVDVTNTTGTTQATKAITVRDAWSFGDVMDYTEGGEFQSSIGYSGDGEISWGVKYPEELMAGRNYVTNVSLYVENAGQYDLRIYQGGTTDPQTLVYGNSYNITTTEQWVDLPVHGGAQLDPTKNLWVTFHCDGVNYPASYCPYNGDPNSHLIDGGTGWVEIQTLASSLDNVTWMIKTTTSATQPTFDFSIAGPTEGSDGDVLTFTIGGPSSATYNWTFQNGTPATATGMTASASWATAGTYTVTVNGTNGSETASHTLQVSIRSCGISTLPYEQGFENDLSCWNVYDADGDGYTWQLNARQATHGGSGNIASASYMNGVGELTPDNWLVSPKITIPSNGATIEWWEYGDETSDFAEHYSVMASWNGNQPSDFTATNAIIFSGEPTQSRTWVKHSRSLAGFAGMDIYIAFRHHDVTNMFWLIIDDVKISAGNTSGIDDVEHLNVAVYPNPTTGRFHITAEGFENVEVFDVTGRNVMNADSDVIDLSAFANGVYTLRVNTTLGSSMQKIVKK